MGSCKYLHYQGKTDLAHHRSGMNIYTHLSIYQLGLFLVTILSIFTHPVLSIDPVPPVTMVLCNTNIAILHSSFYHGASDCMTGGFHHLDNYYPIPCTGFESQNLVPSGHSDPSEGRQHIHKGLLQHTYM